jgi:sugar lactone lactonase YvrE
MKRIAVLISAIIFLFPSILFPRIVDRAEALQTAQSIIRQENTNAYLHVTKGELSVLNLSVLMYQNEPVGYLAELAPHGFMILSDITELAPSRFLSYDTSFEALQEHPLISQILNDSLATKQRLGYSSSASGLRPQSEVLAARIDARQLGRNENLWGLHSRTDKRMMGQATATADSVAPLLTSRWNQFAPYNLETPKLANNSGNLINTLTGCSATSQAQVMYYWKYPAVGQGQNSYYWRTGGITLSESFNTPYDWGSMLDTYKGTETDRQKAAVALLMKDVGYSINMDFGLGSSSAVPNANNSLVRFFKYSSAAKTVHRTSYADADSWFNVFKNQIERGWPALLAIYSPSEGHSVVVDGYQTNSGNQVHINMGWGGSSDAYYTLDNILSFSEINAQYASINIHPPSYSMIFPQVAVGGGYTTVFTFGNTGSEAVSGTLTLIDQQGNPFIVEGTVENPGVAAQPFSGSSFPISIPPGGAAFITARSPGTNDPVRVGWARVESASRSIYNSLYGVSTFQYAPSGLLQSTAGVLPSAPTQTARVLVDSDVDQGRLVGYAIANPGNAAINVNLAVTDQSGKVVDDSIKIELAARQQASGFITDKLPSARFKGSLVLSTQDGDFAVVALMQNQDQLTVVPVQGDGDNTISGTTTTSIAGQSSSYSGDGGPATSAQLSHILGISMDAGGNIFIADTENNRVRKVTPEGTISTVAGNGSAGYSGDGGSAISAYLSSPNGVAVDTAGNLYIADANNGRIRKVTADGTISTVAGSGQYGYAGDGGPAISAQLKSPAGVAVDRTGNLYIADRYNYCVRKVTPGGTISTVAGNGTSGFSGDGGPATSAQLSSPNGVAVDNADNLYIADTYNSRIRKVTPDGTISTVAGGGQSGSGGDGGPATSARLTSPNGVAVDNAGNLYIADTYANRIRKVSPDGKISTVAGNGISGFSGDGSTATSAQLNTPNAVVVDNAGNLFIADTKNSRIRKVTSQGTITTFAGNGSCPDGIPATSARLNNAAALALDAQGNFYIADSENHRIRKVTPQGIIRTVAGDGTSGYGGDGGPATSAQLNLPSGVAVDNAGNLYIADTRNYRIRKVTPQGTISTVAGDGTSAQFGLIYRVAVDNAGNLYISDSTRIRKVTSQGIISTVAGDGTYGYGGDGGPATSAQLNSAKGLAVDNAGNLYIADTSNNRVRKVTPQGMISTVAGIGIYGTAGDGGPATSAQLGYPNGVAVDNAGNLYIADTNSSRIREVSPQGTITTITKNSSYYDVALSATNDLYMAGFSEIRKLTPSRAFLSHVAAGGGYTTVFALGNSGADPLSGAISITDQRGNPLTVGSLVDISGFSTQQMTGSSFPVSIPSGGVEFVTAKSPGANDPVNAGWARVDCYGDSFFSVATFQYAPSGTLLTSAGVLPSQRTQYATIPVDYDIDAERYVGYAIANPGDTTVKIKLALVDQSGNIVNDSLSIPLTPGQQMARFMDQDFEQYEKFKGSMVLRGEDGGTFTVVALTQNQNLLTVIPVMAGKSPNIPD